MSSITIPPPFTMSATGPIPVPPATLRSTLVAIVNSTNPGFTDDLPGSLIEDVVSTDVGALFLIVQAAVDAVNSVSPLTSNPYLTALLGQQFGLMQGATTNTQVDVVFSSPTPGLTFPAGFLVSDGTYQYALQEGTIVGAGGSSPQVTAVATQPGTWPVPAASVTTVISSIPSGLSATVTNPQAGTPSQGPETQEAYQARVIQAGQAAAVGTIQFLKTQIQKVPGVVPRLVNNEVAGIGWKIIVGGGDAYQVAYAIFLGVTDIGRLVGSTVDPTRNVAVTIVDGADKYEIVFINPPLQVVTMSVTWNTNLPNFTAGAQVNSLGATALQGYVNSVLQGQPINLLAATAVFQAAVASVLPVGNLSALAFEVLINAVVVAPEAGTDIIPGDLESYFSAASGSIVVNQG